VKEVNNFFKSYIGPSSIKTVKVKIDNFYLAITGAVLHLRGDSTVSQPLENERFVFLWNGEVFGGLDVDERKGDTKAVFEFIQKFDDKIFDLNHLMDMFSNIQGPYAFILLDKLEKMLYFGRDFLGRRSLLINEKHYSEEIIISSVGNGIRDFKELPSTGIHSISLSNDISKNFVAYPKELVLNKEVLMDTPSELLWETTVNETLLLLTESMKKRILNIPNIKSDDASVAILFSGGLDCSVIAQLANDIAPLNVTIELLNVAFENPRYLKNIKNGSNDIFNVPDRQSGIESYLTLKKNNPTRNFVFVNVNVPFEDTEKHKRRVLSLMKPCSTVMDMSISLPFWFASRGHGVVKSDDNTFYDYKLKSKVLFSGLGADELLGGYGRHRVQFNLHSWKGLVDEMQRDLSRLNDRNLGRDDRIISDHGREVRYPFLDENLIDYWRQLPVRLKCDPTLVEGLGEKILLRKIAFDKLRLGETSHFKKRAIQFGSKTAKMMNPQEKGTDEINFS
ncbi:hypothetical protein ROZALSC1DRAFT_29244, partial [Rozella allomycis CSF55]